MSKHPLLVDGNDQQEFIKLRPIIDQCYQEMVSACLTHQEAELVIKYLHRKIKVSTLNAVIK